MRSSSTGDVPADETLPGDEVGVATLLLGETDASEPKPEPDCSVAADDKDKEEEAAADAAVLGRSGASYASMLVVDSNCTGPEIFPRRIVPELLNLDALSREDDATGADPSRRLLRLVKARVIVDMAGRIKLQDSCKTLAITKMNESMEKQTSSPKRDSTTSGVSVRDKGEWGDVFQTASSTDCQRCQKTGI